MKRFFLVLLATFAYGCVSKPSVNEEDIEYIQTTMDLLKARANFAVEEDSIHLKLSLDSVYQRHHTSAQAYQKQTISLADDPKHAEIVFTAINDSIAKK